MEYATETEKFVKTIITVKLELTLFVFVCLFVCTVTDYSAVDEASGVKFCTAVHRRPLRGISHFGGTLLPQKLPRSLKSDESASVRVTRAGLSVGQPASWPSRWLSARGTRALAESSSALATRRIGMRGYTTVAKGRRTCYGVL